MWNVSSRFWEKFTEGLKLVPSFSRSSLLLAWRSYTFMKIEYAVALLTMMGYRMAQEPAGSDLRSQKKSVSKKILRIKKGT